MYNIYIMNDKENKLCLSLKFKKCTTIIKQTSFYFNLIKNNINNDELIIKSMDNDTKYDYNELQKCWTNEVLNNDIIFFLNIKKYHKNLNQYFLKRKDDYKYEWFRYIKSNQDLEYLLLDLNDFIIKSGLNKKIV